MSASKKSRRSAVGTKALPTPPEPMRRIRTAGGYPGAALVAGVAVIVLLAGCEVANLPATPPATLVPTGAATVPAGATASLAGDPSRAAPTDGPPAGYARFEGPGWHFDYPSSWGQYQGLREPGASLGFVTNEQLDEARACDDTDDETRCQTGPRSGRRDGVLIEISRDACAYGCTLDWGNEKAFAAKVDGVPAKAERGEDGARQFLTWTIADPATAASWFLVRAQLRTDGGPATVAAVEALIASWRFDPPFVPPDLRDTADVAARAVRDAKSGEPSFECVPEERGLERTARVTALGTYQLTRPLEVTCSMSISIVAQLYWLLRMEVAWEAQGGSTANAQVLWLWLTRDGEATWGSRDNARPPYCCVDETEGTG
jgi:hypothetical protein